MPLEALWMSVVQAVSRRVWKSMIRASPDCNRQGSFFSSGIEDCGHTVENERDIEGFYDSPFPHKKNDLDGKPLTRVLKSCDRDADV